MVALPYIDAAEVAAALPLASLIAEASAIFARPVSAPLRLRANGTDGRELLAMPALADATAGVKLLTVVPANAPRGLPVIQGLFVLFDMTSGVPVAIIDAQELTARRTAAVSAVATRSLARDDARTLLLIGSGHLIPYLAEGHAAVRSLDTVYVWARDPEKAQRAAMSIAARVPSAMVAVASDLSAAIAGADIISSATRATKPLIRGALVAPGTHIDLVGAYRPDMREIDDDGVAAARIFVDTDDGALAEAGDLVGPLSRGVIGRDAIIGDLQTLLTGTQRRSREEITLFKSVGSAAVDLAAADLVWRRR